MPDALSTINLRTTPQNEQADPRQRRNSAGGHAFVIDDMARLRRFLVLGTEGGTFYVGERALTRDNAAVVLDLAATRGTEVVAEVVAISTAGRAPRNDPALFTLAAVSAVGDADAKAAVHDALPLVARTGTHLFTFAGYVEQMRGWGRGLRRAVAAWYTGKDADALAHQVTKYRQREGWSHRDLLRLSHPVPVDEAQRAVFQFAVGRESGEHAPRLLDGFRAAQSAETPAATARLVAEHGLTWEMLRSDHLASPLVWQALLDAGMPQTALLRNLPRLTRLGLLAPGGPNAAAVAAQLVDPERLRRARVHPLSVLVALRTYTSGRSTAGSSEWEPVAMVADALDAAFYAAFGAVEPAGKRTLLALDVSGSMGTGIAGLPLTCRDASAALAMVTAAVEPACSVVGFTGSGTTYWRGDTSITALDISPRRRLDDNVRAVSGLRFGATDCSLPMQWALENGVEVDTFAVFCADTETEILTAQGWRRHDDVNVGEEVYTLDHATGLGEWQQTTAINVFPATIRQMVRMEGRGHSSLTTLDHRWPVRNRGASTWGRRWQTSETLTTVDYVQCAAVDSGLPVEAKFSDAFVGLMGWIWTEGYVVPGVNSLSICQSRTVNEDYCALIESALYAHIGPPHTGDIRTIRTAAVRGRDGKRRQPTPAWQREDRVARGMSYWHLN